MALFSRRRQDASPAAGSSSTAEPGERASASARGDQQAAATGPWDSASLPSSQDGVRRLDLGALRIPEVDGMRLRMERPGTGALFGAVVIILAGSSLELSAFAAPRTTGIWDELKDDMCAELTRTGARHEVVPGTHGQEILAQLPVRGPDGQVSTVAARFVGVDGPRWFLRGVLQGRAATDEAAAATLRGVLEGVVVVRDGAARPPREPLPLHRPGQAPAPQTQKLPGLEPLAPGPTIAEVR